MTDRYKSSATYLHRLGSDPEQDPVVFGKGVSAGVEIAPDDYPHLITSATKRQVDEEFADMFAFLLQQMSV